MARNKHNAAEAIRERVGKGTAVTDYSYNIPISKPAKVIEGSANPEVVGSMSDIKEAQGIKIVVGLLMTITTWLLVGSVAMFAYNEGARLTLDIVGGVYVSTIAVLVAVSISQYKARKKSSFEQVIWIVAATAIFLMLRSLYLGTEEKTAMLIIAFWLAALNPFGLAKLITGMGGWNDANVTRGTLYVNEQTVYTNEGASAPAASQASSGASDEPVLVGVRDNGQLLFPAVNGLPFLVRQVEDFCYTALLERATEKGLGSGLAREAMLNQMIGPRNNTVANRPQSYIKVTRGVYDAVMAGLYATGLVEDGDKGSTWTKIKKDTQFTCGYSINEIRTTLLAHSNQSVGK
jgi:hypothetical protein